MIKETIKIEGMEELKRLLAALPDETAIKVLKPAVRSTVKVTQGYARVLAPRDTGSLQENIAVRRVRGNYPWREEYGLMVRTERRLTMRRGNKGTEKAILEGGGMAKGSKRDPFYWFFLEFGTVHMDARPFMRPALQDHLTETIDTFKQLFHERLEKAVKNLARQYQTIKTKRLR